MCRRVGVLYKNRNVDVFGIRKSISFPSGVIYYAVWCKTVANQRGSAVSVQWRESHIFLRKSKRLKIL